MRHKFALKKIVSARLRCTAYQLVSIAFVSILGERLYTGWSMTRATQDASFELSALDRAMRRTPQRRAEGERSARAVERSIRASWSGLIAPLAFGAVVAAILAYGWMTRDDEHFNPEEGIGYWLGIAGASTMLLLLLYPLRKRWKAMARLGNIAGWFRWHMVFGIVGPSLILFHSNFRLGSLNSNVALISMLVVASSGIVGRYLYARIHMGLYGRKTTAIELLEEVDDLQRSITGGLQMPERLRAGLIGYADAADRGRRGTLASLAALLTLRLSWRRRRHIERQLEDLVNAASREQGAGWLSRRQRIKAVRRTARSLFAAAHQAAAFTFYERMFALWHILHLPLFILLVLTGIAHVVAVHLY